MFYLNTEWQYFGLIKHGSQKVIIIQCDVITPPLFVCIHQQQQGNRKLRITRLMALICAVFINSIFSQLKMRASERSSFKYEDFSCGWEENQLILDSKQEQPYKSESLALMHYD